MYTIYIYIYIYIYNHKNENVDSYVSIWFSGFLISSKRHECTNIILGNIVYIPCTYKHGHHLFLDQTEKTDGFG